MTVRTEDGTTERATPETLRRAAVLDDQQAAELTRLGVQIEALYGMPMDIEWAIQGTDGAAHVAILQARPITALPPPAGRPTRLAAPQARRQVRPRLDHRAAA